MGRLGRLAVLCVGVGVSLFACGKTSDDESEIDPGAMSADPRGASGAAGAGQLPSGGAGASVSNGGAAPTAAAGATATSSPLPSYSRDCLTGRIADDARGSGASAASGEGGASAASASDPETTPGAGAGGADFGLGAGDLSVLVVFDKSGSMGSGWDERSKWQVANEAFMKAIEGVLDNLTLGTIFFPVGLECDVPPLTSELQLQFLPGGEFATIWQETEASRGPDGGTPLGRAFVMADMALERACQLGLLDDRFRVVVITDGEPNCDTDVASLTRLPEEWAKAGVETRVMGLPGSTAAKALLDAIALAGGSEKAQILGQPSELDHGLYTAVR